MRFTLRWWFHSLARRTKVALAHAVGDHVWIVVVQVVPGAHEPRYRVRCEGCGMHPVDDVILARHIGNALHDRTLQAAIRAFPEPR